MEQLILKMNNICKKIWKYSFILEFLLSCLLGYSILNIIYFKSYFDIWSLKHLIIAIITGIPLCIIMIRNIITNKEKLEKVFLTIAIPLSIGYSLFVLINKIPDENWHIYRSYNIARGNIIINVEENNESIPIEITKIENINNYQELFQIAKEETKLSGEEKSYFNTFEIYFPIIYIGPVIGLKIASLFKINIILAIYLMRLMNIIIYLILGYFTIKWIPFGKLLTMTYLCIPMFIHQAASTSADTFINSMCLLFIAYNMKLLFKKENYSLKEKILYFVLALGATLNKLAYIPLAFLSLLLIFNKKYPKSKQDKIFMGTTVAIMVILSGIWYLFGTQYEDTREYIIENGISSSEQLEFIKSNPFKFVQVLSNTFNKNTTNYIYQALGERLALLNIKIDSAIPTIYLGMLIFAIFLEKSKIKLSNWQKVWIALLVIGMIGLIYIALYLGWTVPGADIIDGIQGRYFLPFAILAFLCFIPKEKYLKFKNKVPTYTILIILLNLISLNEIIITYIDK